MPLLAFPATAVLLVTLVAAPPRAPSPEEQRAFAAGLRLYEAGDARGAERAWRAGYSSGHDPAFLVRIGEAEEKAGAPQEAAQTYQQYLRESPDAADRPDIEQRVRRLIPATGQQQPPGGVESPGEMRGAPRAADTPPPAASAAAELPKTSAGQGPQTTAPVGAAPQHQDQGNDNQGNDNRDDPRPLFGQDAHRSRLNTVGWVGVGVTTLMLGVAAFFGASAADKAGDANRLLAFRDLDTGVPREYATQSAEYEEDLRVGRRDDRLAKGFLIAAGVTAVASTLLFVLEGSAPAVDGHDMAARAPTLRPAVKRTPSAIAWESASTAKLLGLSWGF